MMAARCGTVEPFRRCDTTSTRRLVEVLIEHILHHKGDRVETIAADATVVDALARMDEHNVGALVVTGGDAGAPHDTGAGRAVRGILSERDVVRALAGADDPAATLRQPVASLMTTDVTTCAPRATVDELMRLMTERRVRHIPVLDGDRLAGIVSIGDVVKTRIDELQTETDTLHEYLTSGR
jgi:CBS domain-containing protein